MAVRNKFKYGLLALLVSASLTGCGLDGDDGEQGETGAQGPQGAQGPIGYTGSAGATGPQGPAGSTGPTGPTGPTGFTGSAGTNTIPQSGAEKTGSYTLATGDVGDFVVVGSGGSITIPNATFSTGDVVSIYNNTSGAITITCSITTAYVSGVNSDRSSVSILSRGIATVLFANSTVAVITGSIL